MAKGSQQYALGGQSWETTTQGCHHHHFQPLGTGGTALLGSLFWANAFSGLELGEEGGWGEGCRVDLGCPGLSPQGSWAEGFYSGSLPLQVQLRVGGVKKKNKFPSGFVEWGLREVLSNLQKHLIP